MAPRALGALFALVAAVAFVVSIASSSWWSGSPDVAGRTISAKTVRVGLVGATGCNTGGDGSCEPVELGGTMQAAGLVELGAIGLATILAFALAISAWTIGDRRKGLAKALVGASVLAVLGAAFVLAVGPSIEATQDVDVPIGWGTFVFGGAIVAALSSSAVAMRLEPEPLRLKPGVAPAAPPPDVRDIVREHNEGLRPSQAALFGGAPQLRPLYDPANQGYVPAPVSPPLPLSPPTPLPQSMVDQLTGYTAPVADVSPAGGARPALPRTPLPPSPPPPSRAHAPSSPPPSPRTQRATNPPATRVAPPVRPSVPMPDRTKAPSVAPPLPPAPPRRRTVSGPGTDPSVASLPRTPSSDLAQKRPSAPTMSHSVPPMPESTPPPTLHAAPRSQRAATDHDDRLEKALRETDYVTAVEVDADGKAAAAAAEVTETNLRIETRMTHTGEESRVTPAPVAAGARRPPVTGRHGEEPSVGPPVTLELAAQTALADGDPLAIGRATYELAAQTAVSAEDPLAGDSAVGRAPLTEEMAAPRITGELAALAHDGNDVTDASQAPDVMGERDGRTPMPSIAPRGPDVTPIPTRAAQAAPVSSRPAAISTAPANLKPPNATEVATSGPTPACPQCEAPMAWVDEHLRFYCKQCRMYF